MATSVLSSTFCVARVPFRKVQHRNSSIYCSNSLVAAANVRQSLLWQRETSSPSRRCRQPVRCQATVQAISGTNDQQIVWRAPDALQAALNSKADAIAGELYPFNIFLIGMMGCGKTTVGRILSEGLGYSFFDSDTLVEQTVGSTVASIFGEQGEAAFRELESQAVAHLASMPGLVVATGGGAVLREANWQSMQREGIVVWIDAPLEVLATRVVAAGVASRPILAEGHADKDAVTQAFCKLQGVFEKRRHLYPQADVRISLKDVSEKMGCHGSEIPYSNFISPAAIALRILEEVESVIEQRKQVFCCSLPRPVRASEYDWLESSPCALLPAGRLRDQQPQHGRVATSDLIVAV